MALFELNGKTYFLDCRKIEVKEVSNGRYDVTFSNYGDDVTFQVVGGRKSGGASNEWFCYRPEMFGEMWIPTSSMIAAIRKGVCY